MCYSQVPTLQGEVAAYVLQQVPTLLGEVVEYKNVAYLRERRRTGVLPVLKVSTMFCRSSMPVEPSRRMSGIPRIFKCSAI